MTIEKMADQQVETRRGLEQLERRKARERNRFIASGIEEQSDAMARWSVSPTPIPSFGRTMPEVAAALSHVEIVDPNIARRVKEISKKDREMTEDNKAFMASVALAKANVIEGEGNLTSEEKKGLEQFKKTILNGIGKIIGRTGRERALRTTAAISLTLTACSTAITRKTPEATQRVEPVATEVTSIPTETEEPTPTPTEMPTVTPTPEAPEVPYKVEDEKMMEWRDGDWIEVNLPEGVENAEIVLREEGILVLQIDGLEDEKLVIAERAEGEWRLTDFDITLPPDVLLMHTESTKYYSSIDNDSKYNSEGIFNLRLNMVALTGIHFAFDRETGSSNIIFLTSWGGKVFRFEPSMITVAAGEHPIQGVRIDPTNLYLADVNLLVNKTLEVFRQQDRLLKFQLNFLTPSSKATNSICQDEFSWDQGIEGICSSILTSSEIPETFKEFEGQLRENMVVPTSEIVSSADNPWWLNDSVPEQKRLISFIYIFKYD